MIEEGSALADRALRRLRGPYALEAAIAALHANADSPAATDWHGIAELYKELLELTRSSVVKLNYAVAVAFSEGLEKGLELINELASSGELDAYYLLPAAQAEILRRLGKTERAAAAYRAALALASNGAERRYLARRLEELTRP